MTTPTGWSLEQFLRMTHRWGGAHNQPTAVPNCETAVRGGTGRVWGVYSVHPGPSVSWRDVRGRGDQGGLGISGLTPVPDAWRAAHRYATARGFQTGLLTFEASHVPDGSPIYGLLHVGNSPLIAHDVPAAELDSHPGFGAPDLVIRDINRWAVRHGYAWGFPTFEAGHGAYGAFLLPPGTAFASWNDVPESQIRVPSSPTINLVSVSMKRQSTTGFQWSGAPIPSALTDKPITSVRFGCGSAWSVTSVDLQHNGRTVRTLPMSQTPPLFPALHDFDAMTAAGTWTATVAGSGLTQDDCWATIEVQG